MPRHGDRVKETSPTTGTGTLDLAGAPTGFRAFADEFASGQAEIPYLLVDDVDNPTQYEVGYGTFTNASPDTFARDTVHASSNGGSKVSWVAGCTVINCATSEWLNTLGEMTKVAQKTGAYTITANDRFRTIEATSGSWTLTLLAAATAGNGFAFFFRNTGSGTVTLDGNASETIDGATTLAVTQGGSFLVICNGTGWITVGNASVAAASDTVAGKIEIADQSEMEAGSSTTLAVTPGRIKYHPGVIKFWVNFSPIGGTGTATNNASHNVTSVADNGAGDFTVTIADDMSSANWAPQVSIEISGQRWNARVNSKAAGTVTIACWSDVDGAAVDPTAIFVSGLGDQ